MRLVTFDDGGSPRFGVLEGDSIRDVTATDPGLPSDVVGVIRGGDAMLDRVQDALADSPIVPLGTVALMAPIPDPPGDVIAVGRNYRDHAQEFSDSGFDASEKSVVPDHPVVFTKATSSIIGPGAPIVTANDPTASTDYEGELAIVIGKPARSVDPATAFDHVFGYTIVNDVTARHLQARHVQWFIGKSPDTFCPMGPCLVTKDEIADLASTELRTEVNGELRQSYTFADMIFDIPTLIATLSEVMTLAPGTVIATGTGTGVGIGFDPPKFLQPGDLVEITVEGIGTLSNPVK